MSTRRTKGIICVLLAVLTLLGAAFYALPRLKAAPEEAVPREAPPVRLNEIMSANDSFPADDGEFYDWVELRNVSAAAVDLGGWGLSDREDQIKYIFPQGTVIPAGGYALVYCAKSLTRSDTAFFGISAQGGDSVCLFAPDGYVEEAVAVPPVASDWSYCRFEDGRWAISISPTPGADNIANDPEAPHDPLLEGFTVVISELMSSNNVTIRDADGDYSDWVELYNAGEETCDLSGWFLSDDEGTLRKWTIPSLVIQPGEYKVIFCSGKDRADAGELHTSFALQRDGGGIYLSSPLGVRADELVYEPMEKEQAAVRTNDGVVYSYLTTPGFENTSEGYEAFLTATDNPGELVINEAVAYNSGTIRDGRGYVYDWIELKNLTRRTISLNGYTLTNDPTVPDKCVLPNVRIGPNAYFIVFCSADAERQDGVHGYAPFNIGTGGEFLYLYGPDGELADSVYVHDLPAGGSIGRVVGSPGFFLFEKATPSRLNGTGYRSKAEVVTAGVSQGIYNDVADALLVTLEGEGTIYYTLNGADPTRASLKYTQPLLLTKTTVVRAVSCADGKALSDISSFTYIINENHTLPVLSLVCNTKNLRTVMGASLRTTQADGELTLFTEEGIEFSRGCSIRLHGNTSRYVHAKKMFVVEFNERFGGDLYYDVFHDGEVTQFSSLMLRAETPAYMYILRDSVASLAAKRVSDKTFALNNRYCILYINGSYYGLCPLREDFSRQYVASHTGSSVESCIVVKAPVRNSDKTGLYGILDQTIMRNMADEANYAWACEHWDMENIADWILLEGYFNNTDVGGNVRYISGDNTDGKWMLAFYDLDIAFGNESPGFGVVVYGTDQINWLVQSLLASSQFRQLVAERCVILLDNGLADNIVLQIIDECAAEIDAEIPREIKRWAPSTSWAIGLRSMRNYFSDARIPLYIQTVSSLLKLTPEEKDFYFGRFLDTE